MTESARTYDPARERSVLRRTLALLACVLAGLTEQNRLPHYRETECAVQLRALARLIELEAPDDLPGALEHTLHGLATWLDRPA